MRLIRAVVTLAVAAVFGLVGLAFLAHGRPAIGTVWDTDARGPKVTLDGGPQVERAPRLRVLVGTNRKSARWVEVNVVQYASCSVGNGWNGRLCSKTALAVGSFHLDARSVALGLIAVAMVITPIVAGVATSRPHD